MRGRRRQGLITAGLITAGLLGACSGKESTPLKSPAAVRAARRAYDGAPPVIGHPPLGTACLACHAGRGQRVSGLGFAPPAPHAATAMAGTMRRCEQCHVHALTSGLFRPSGFRGLAQDLRKGARLNPLAPPVIPHQILLRENCAACHTGPAAREEIRCRHPERLRCRQCHVPVLASGRFRRPG